MANNRPIRHVPIKGWWPRRRKRRSPGEYNVISEATASAMACSSPFRDGSCSWSEVLLSGFPCDYTQPCPVVILSSAAEGDLAGQPLWPKHTVESVRGEIHLFTTGLSDMANIHTPPGGVLVHMGIRKTRFDYDAVTPTFESDFDPGHEDDAEARWIWTKHVYIPPGSIPTSSGNIGDGSGSQWGNDFAGLGRNRASVMLNERNRVRLGENEGLILVTSISPDPWLGGGNTFTRPFGLIHGHGAELIFTSKLRTYVRQSK